MVRSGRMRAESNSTALLGMDVTWAGTNRLTAISGSAGVRRERWRKGKCGESELMPLDNVVGVCSQDEGCRDGKGYDVKRAMAHSAPLDLANKLPQP